jgi:N-acetylmuramoyl-L-alanine amidase
METTTVLLPKMWADFLLALGIAKLPEAPKQPEPVKPLWQQFIAAVKASDMTNAMKVACVAQAINESGRGTSRVAKECNNFWGIKMRSELDGLAVGRRVEVTSETEGFAVFAQFPDVATGIKGWLKFLTRSYYKGWEAYKNDAAGFIRHIGKSWTPKKTYADEVIRGFAEAEILLGIKLPQDQISTKKRIFLDPGHAESKVGARSKQGAQEEDLNRLQAQVIKAQLEATGRFDVTIFDPATDNLVEIGKAAKGHDMSIHLHHNSYKGEEDPGTEVLYDNDKAEAQSKELAEKMSAAISRALGTKNRGAKPFAGTVMDVAEQQGTFPVVLTESYFLNMYSQGAAEQRSTLAAVAIADVVEDWF